MNNGVVKMLKNSFVFICILNVSIYSNICYAESFSVRLVADTASDIKVVGDTKTSKEGVLKWYPVSDKIFVKLKKEQGIPIKQQDNGKLEILLRCSNDDLTMKDIENIRDSSDSEGLPIFIVGMKLKAQERLLHLTSQNIGKFIAEVVNGEVVDIAKIQTPIKEYIALRNVDKDQLKNVLSQQATSVSYLDKDDYPIQLTVWHLILFLFLLAIVILNFVPTKGMLRKKTPRIWILLFAIVLGVLGSWYLGITYSSGSKEMMDKYNAIVKETHYSLINLFLGAIAGAFLGIVCSYPAWFLLRRAGFNIHKLFVKVGGKPKE